MDAAGRRFSRKVAIQNLAALGLGVVGGVVAAVIEVVDGRVGDAVLALACAGLCGRLASRQWAMQRAFLAVRADDNDDAESAGLGSLAPAKGPLRPAVKDATVWWYWVRPRLTTTRYSVTDADGEWVGAFDRRGHLGHRARAQDLDYDGFDLVFHAGRAHLQAVIRGELVSRIVEDQLQIGEHTLEIDLPRDARFSCTIRRGAEVLLTVRRWDRRPFARIEVAAGMPEPSIVVLLVLFVLTCDHDLANTMHTG